MKMNRIRQDLRRQLGEHVAQTHMYMLHRRTPVHSYISYVLSIRNMYDLDFNKFKYTKAVKVDNTRELPRHKNGEKFLKGPIPEPWLAQTAHLRGKTFAVAMNLWLLAGIKRESIVKLSQKLLRSWGVDRFACYRALAALEKVKLISVERHRGRNPIVTILAVDEGIELANAKSGVKHV